MLYFMNNKRVTLQQIEERFPHAEHPCKMPEVREIKAVDNYHCGNIFQVAQRVRFKHTQKGWNETCR